MLQRSPTYFSPGVNKNKLADMLREMGTDPFVVHELVRKRIVFEGRRYLQHTLENPEAAKQELLASLAKHLPKDVIDAHFTPAYRPWQQRIAVVPDADLFKCVAAGTASVVTDQIDHFTQHGIVLRSGKLLEADIVVTATGFDLCVFGDISFSVDGRPVDFSETVTYRGMMFTGIPNMAWIMGYFRAASWTLRVDLVGDFVCRLLDYMDERRLRKVEVVLPDADKDMDLLPWIDDQLFNPGYMMRGQHALPRRGAKHEWGHSQDYWADLEAYPHIDFGAQPFRFDAPPVSLERGASDHTAAKPG
jgi:cation diffusion facilitator CzcD-associated flavoprotein CzcO